MTFDVGTLDRRVVFDAPYAKPDGSGGIETAWREEFTAWASFRWLRGGEAVQGARLQGRQPALVRVHANHATRLITPAWRLRDRRTYRVDADGDPIAGVFNIRTAVETEDRMWIELTAETGVAV